MMFTFVYTGWKGSANDSRVFLDCVTRPSNKFPWPREGGFYLTLLSLHFSFTIGRSLIVNIYSWLEGHYYLVDASFPITLWFLPPYKGKHYHLTSFRIGGCARGPRELLNYQHSSLRMMIKHCLGILKNWFLLLDIMSCYKPVRQALFQSHFVFSIS